MRRRWPHSRQRWGECRGLKGAGAAIQVKVSVTNTFTGSLMMAIFRTVNAEMRRQRQPREHRRPGTRSPERHSSSRDHRR